MVIISVFAIDFEIVQICSFANILCLLLAEMAEQRLYFNDIEKSKQYLYVHCINTWH